MKKFLDWTDKVEARMLAKKYLGIPLYWLIMAGLTAAAIALGYYLHINLKHV